MTRLRRDEEQRAYERMVNPPLRTETFADRFPHAALAHKFSEVNRPKDAVDDGENDVTYVDVHRQLMLIFNFMASILGVAATVWVVARWWSTPARVFVTLASAILVAVAEVAVYSGYIWRMGEAKTKQAKVKEVKEIMQTWVVGVDEPEQKTDIIPLKKKDESLGTKARRRKK